MRDFSSTSTFYRREYLFYSIQDTYPRQQREMSMNTLSTEDESGPATETWSAKSKKDMFLGFIVVIAAIALAGYII